ncbi:sugar kinase [Desulforhopalus vacuolatus]|uniref:NAD(P)H-hydrate dehydratase n=1 Tax=Desulforhopalus vacuolatus TaxID=40414 RepID=UPI0019657793|nr:NAD(P)H-hydrate dehydratase [Desulforhopalus vacuolatus]MBM9520334.1 sugar kinase [Desulforhopalus vacuolatus]
MPAIVGTVPDDAFPLVSGKVRLKGDVLEIQGLDVPVNRGTPALAAAVLKACEVLGNCEVTGFLVGDIGLGKGSRKLYSHLVDHLPAMEIHTLAFHYLQPDVDWHNRIVFAVEAMAKKPLMIADAGFMYAAKMSGQAGFYDLFTPDAGELAFLADETAPHPFYTRGFILHDENRAEDLIQRAYFHNNGATCLLVKGKSDHVANEKGILATVDSPEVEAMEAIGGTGDTLTGIVTALVDSGMAVPLAAEIAAKTNRLAGFYANPTPASSIVEIIHQIPRALAEVLAATS